MKKSKKMMIVAWILLFFTLFSFPVSMAIDGEGESKEAIVNALRASQTRNPFEMTLSEILLAFGDKLLEYIIFIYNDDISIDRIVFNKINALDPDFFKYNNADFVNPTTEAFCGVINAWYQVFKGITIVFFLMLLVSIGIKIMLGPAKTKADAREYLVNWVMGVAILGLFPYVMKYAFKINDGIVNMIRDTFAGSANYNQYIGSYIGKVSDVSYDQMFEERSPAYISRSDYVYSLGSPESTIKYFENLQTYKDRGDIMRIMRAMAGITGKLIYVVLWIIMLWQMIILLFMYTKRYLMIAFLIIIFPLSVAQYVIGLMRTGKGGAGFSAWCMEFFLNVFIQTVHAVIYGIIGGVVMANVQSMIATEGINRLNWVVLIVAINFLFEGEKILKKIIKANAESVRGGDETRGMFKGARKNIKKIFKM